jgi:hypothetical protein
MTDTTIKADVRLGTQDAKDIQQPVQHDGGTDPTHATNKPVDNMPVTARARAELRMGKRGGVL